MTQSLGRAAASAVRNLRELIETGAFSDHGRLPPERELASELGIARNTLRQALRRLEEEGILQRQVGRGTFIQAPTDADQSDALSPLRHMRRASPADLMEVRLIIEPRVAMLAANRANTEDMKLIETALRNSISARGVAEFEHWDAQLHLAIFRASKNAVLFDYCEAINAARNDPNWFQLKKRTVTPELRHVYDGQHADLVAALKERDAEAARRHAHAHLSMVRDNMLGTLD